MMQYRRYNSCTDIKNAVPEQLHEIIESLCELLGGDVEGEESYLPWWWEDRYVETRRERIGDYDVLVALHHMFLLSKTLFVHFCNVKTNECRTIFMWTRG